MKQPRIHTPTPTERQRQRWAEEERLRAEQYRAACMEEWERVRQDMKNGIPIGSEKRTKTERLQIAIVEWIFYHGWMVPVYALVAITMAPIALGFINLISNIVLSILELH